MKRIYISGAYSADNVLDVLRNIGRGQKMAAKLFSLGFAPFCPWHDKSFVTDRPDDEFTVEQFYEYSLAWLVVSDAMFLLPGWEKSAGTVKEHRYCLDNGIPMFETIGGLILWGNDHE